ncbi:MAG: hypothetical protein ACAH12_10395 [Methylophilaceae bacterium]|uniref:hypothetical protein n=1 Tax=Methylotenera sp. N17 TaxID=1502761 RepID=UPI0006491F6F|nr:hypothetical protein [Methylotenera sp. N17]
MLFEWPQIWGFGLAFVGLVFLLRRKIDVGIQGRPTSYVVTGKWAIILSLLTIVLGLFVGFQVPKQLKIDSCLDNGGKYNYQKSLCEHN